MGVFQIIMYINTASLKTLNIHNFKFRLPSFNLKYTALAATIHNYGHEGNDTGTGL